MPAGRRSRPASAVPQPQQLSTPPPTTSYTRPTPPQPAPPLGNAPLSAPRPRAPAPTAPPPAAPAPRLAAPAPRPVASVTRASEILVEDFDDLGLQDESYAAPVRTATVAVRGAAQGYSVGLLLLHSTHTHTHTHKRARGYLDELKIAPTCVSLGCSHRMVLGVVYVCVCVS